jgi:hypothetical protein
MSLLSTYLSRVTKGNVVVEAIGTCERAITVWTIVLLTAFLNQTVVVAYLLDAEREQIIPIPVVGDDSLELSSCFGSDFTTAWSVSIENVPGVRRLFSTSINE